MKKIKNIFISIMLMFFCFKIENSSNTCDQRANVQELPTPQSTRISHRRISAGSTSESPIAHQLSTSLQNSTAINNAIKASRETYKNLEITIQNNVVVILENNINILTNPSLFTVDGTVVTFHGSLSVQDSFHIYHVDQNITLKVLGDFFVNGECFIGNATLEVIGHYNCSGLGYDNITCTVYKSNLNINGDLIVKDYSYTASLERGENAVVIQDSSIIAQNIVLSNNIAHSDLSSFPLNTVCAVQIISYQGSGTQIFGNLFCLNNQATASQTGVFAIAVNIEQQGDALLEITGDIEFSNNTSTAQFASYGILIGAASAISSISIQGDMLFKNNQAQAIESSAYGVFIASVGSGTLTITGENIYFYNNQGISNSVDLDLRATGVLLFINNITSNLKLISDTIEFLYNEARGSATNKFGVFISTNVALQTDVIKIATDCTSNTQTFSSIGAIIENKQANNDPYVFYNFNTGCPNTAISAITVIP